MKARDIEIFFEELDRRIDFPLDVILTGGSAAILYGVERATEDIDFEVHLTERKRSVHWQALEQACAEVGRMTTITPQYAEDIDKWSSIALPAKLTTPYRKIGKITVRILRPALWAIGKLTRFLETDVEDLVKVLRAQRPRAENCARTWGQALAESSPSLAQSSFPRHVEQFFDLYAKTIWGTRAKPKELKELFLRTARKA